MRDLVKHRSHREADDADRAYYRSLQPEARLEILLELIASVTEALPEAQQGLARVHRIARLGER